MTRPSEERVALQSISPVISVIIPNYNHGDFILEALDSVLNQTFKNIEVIIVDGGSTSQSTLDTLRAIRDARVTVYFREGRHFVGSNRNFGIERSRGDYICCVDADDTIEKTYLEKAYYLAVAGGVDVVSTSVRLFGARNGSWDIGEQPTLDRLLVANDVCVSAFFRRSKWAEVGGYFDTGIGKDLVAEDWDFWIRLAASGATFWNINRERLLGHREHDGPSLGRAPANPNWAVQLRKIKSRNRALVTKSAIVRSAAVNGERNWRPVTIELANFEPTERTCILFMPRFFVGGAERLFCRICKHLKGLGWKPIVVSTRSPDAEAASSRPWFDQLDIEIFALPDFLPPALYQDFAKHLVRTRAPRYIINGGSRVFYEASGDIKREHPRLTIVDFLFNPVGHAKSHLEFQHNFDLAFAESRVMRDWYVEHGWPSERIHTIALGVDLEVFHPEKRPAEVASRQEVAPDEIVVGYIGRMAFEKGPLQFIEIADRLAHVPKLKFVMAGDGAQSKLVKATVDAIGDVDRLKYLGVLETREVASLLNLCDILVVPSRHDGRPLIVLEAFASGVPVIASRLGALPELIEDGRTGYLCDPLRIDEMAERIAHLAGDAALRRRMAEAARATAELYFKPDAGLDELRAVFSAKSSDSPRSLKQRRTSRAEPIVVQ